MFMGPASPSRHFKKRSSYINLLYIGGVCMVALCGLCQI